MIIKMQRPVARVLFVHGLWMSGYEGYVLARRLAREAFALERFEYVSRHEFPGAVAARLTRMLVEDPATHLVGHSLGGMLSLAAIAQAGSAWAGRAVLLGSPLAGSEAARRLARLPGGSWCLGAACDWLTDPPPLAPAAARVAVIAGTRNIGFGRLLGGCLAPADGVIRVAEARIRGIEPTTVRANHLGLLFNRRVAALVATFLNGGRLGAF